MASNVKMNRSGVSGMSISGGIEFSYLAVLDPKLQMKTRSAAAILDVMLQ